MNMIAAINALEELDPLRQADGIMLTNSSPIENDSVMQRLLMQSLLLLPPETRSDPRLKQLHDMQTAMWYEKIQHCSKKQLCVRFPDGPIDAFLPSLQEEFQQLSAFMSCTNTWLRERVQAVWNSNPDLNCYMVISNDILFETLLRGLFSAAQDCGIERLSILLPQVSRCREVQQQNMFASLCAVDYNITCDVGLELSVPRAMYFAGELTEYADVIVFNVDELCWMLYGKAHTDTRHQFGFDETPFNEFDDIGINTMLGVAISQIRSVRPDIRLCAIGKYVLTEKGKKFCQELGIQSVIAPYDLFSE